MPQGKRTIYLMRHAHAEPLLLGEQRDVDRPLSVMGEVQAQAASHIIESPSLQGLKIYCSPYVRTVRTAEIIAECLGLSKPVIMEYLAFGSDVRQIIGEMNTWDDATALLVGHEPHLRELIEKLAGNIRLEEIKLPNACVACLTLRRPIVPGEGSLEWIRSPEV